MSLHILISIIVFGVIIRAISLVAAFAVGYWIGFARGLINELTRTKDPK